MNYLKTNKQIQNEIRYNKIRKMIDEVRADLEKKGILKIKANKL